MKLLIAVDGSSQSDEAVRSVDCFLPDSQVILLHIIDPIRMYPAVGFDLPVVYSKEVQQALRDRGMQVLERAASLIPSVALTRRLEMGFPAEAIVTVARQEKADLILVGARGLGPIQELVFGSVSHGVLAHAPCPVLVLRDSLAFVRRILAPAETEEDADRILRFLASRPFREPPEVRFVTIRGMDLAFAEPILPDERRLHAAMEGAHQAAHRFAERARELGYQATEASFLGTPAESILQEAETAKSDLILLGSRGRSAVSRFLLGSVGHTVLHRARKAVLVVRGEPREARVGPPSPKTRKLSARV